MYGWAGLRERGQKLVRRCRKAWPEVVGIEIDGQGQVYLVRLVCGEAWQIGGAVQLPAEPLALADQAEKSGIDLQNQTIFISHGDCVEEAN